MRKVLALTFIVTLLPSLLFSGCSKENKDTTTTIYGTVVDARTGEGMPAVQVSFGEGSVYPQYSNPNYNDVSCWQSYASTVTGMDGQFEMTFSQQEINGYTLSNVIRAKKSGFHEYIEERNVTLGQGNKYQMDIAMQYWY